MLVGAFGIDAIERDEMRTGVGLRSEFVSTRLQRFARSPWRLREDVQ
jgi:hypothetical protein